MILGMDTFTFIHVALSLIAIAAGVIVFLGFVADASWPGLTAVFLLTTVLTSVTGFGFAFTQLLPSHIVGIISLVILAIALYALYGANLRGAWRWIYVVTASTALYLNVFVLIVQLFQKVPALHALAPTMGDPPFIAAQTVALVAFLVLGWLAVRNFHPGGGAPAVVRRAM
ncbi:hypothetical protein [Hyphomicrobium sp.]|uniref:hypothetical protein n=1 Tax=Hyphomicrobium sp. TaxID=82 RepID=UPI001D3F7A40|nr:hypothetical protein [Hyphomicrobium sp.]MBY0559512.1 hypothetical protein [Hyphomicrobium sp.]